MKIRYTKKRLRYYLIFGILWMVLGSSATIFESGNVFNYGYLIMGILYLGTYLFENRKQYLTIENGVISKNLLVPKKINLNEITLIKKFAGDYVLKTDLTELKINTGLIDKTSLSDLNAVLDNLNLEKKIKTFGNTGYSSLLPTFLSESPRKFAIFGLRRKILADFHATKP